jgi:hypothetical protein
VRFIFFYEQNRILALMISRLEADTRIAEVFVSNVKNDETLHKTLTTIKFLEYDTKGKPLTPRYFTFAGNIIQFQSLVVRFNDEYVKWGDPWRGKSVYLFWKVFMLKGPQTEEFEITPMNEVPEGYKVSSANNIFEQNIWANFWLYALDPGKSKMYGIKSAQIEAPGTKFVPGILYTLKIEHDGGIRIDTSPIPQILKGEAISH